MNNSNGHQVLGAFQNHVKRLILHIHKIVLKDQFCIMPMGHQTITSSNIEEINILKLS